MKSVSIGFPFKEKRKDEIQSVTVQYTHTPLHLPLFFSMKKKKKVENDESDEEGSLNLNRDVISHILTRVPAKPLLSMKCISRGWNNIISSRSFIKDQLKNTNLVLNAFIVQDRYMFCKHDVKTISYIPVQPKNAAKLVVHHNVFSFLPQDVVVLASCKGILCCRTCFPSPNPNIYLCNPSNKEWIQFNCPPQCHITDSIALAFDFDFDPSKFKLVRVKRIQKYHDDDDDDDDESFYFTFEVYSSETKAWKKSNEICDCNYGLIKNKGLYIGGVLHWLTEGDQIITFNVEKELSLMISVPVPSCEFRTFPQACIGEYEGRLHYVQVSEQGLHVWCLDSLEDYFDFKWVLKHCKLLEDFEAEYPRLFLNLRNRVLESDDTNPWMNPLGFKDGKLLIKVSVELYIYDMKNHKIAHACSFLQLNPQSLSHPTVFPHSLTLVSLKDP